MTPFAVATTDVSFAFIELGLAGVGLGLLSRLATKWRFSAIPLYLLAGLAFGNGGLLPIRFIGDFVHFGSEVGVVLLLFMLGLEYTGRELTKALKEGLVAGIVDFLLNFTPGFAAGWILGFGPIASILMGGVTYITSSGVVAKTLGDLGRLKSPETPAIVSVLVLEDLAMAIYLPIVAVMLSGKGAGEGAVAVAVALGLVLAILWVAVRHGRRVGTFLASATDEGTLLTIIGLVLFIAGVAQRIHVSSAVGAFLVGVAISGSITHRVHRLFSPLRDLFAAIFFLFFGLQIDPSSLLPVLPIATVLAAVTTLTKVATGWVAARRNGCGKDARIRAGAALVSRGEFSVVIAGLGVSGELDARMGPITAAYVLITALLGPLLTKLSSRYGEPGTTAEARERADGEPVSQGRDTGPS